MKISNKKLEKAIVELTVAFESDEWKSTQDKALNKLAKSVKIDGFRPGKAPVALIKSRISKASILQEASDMILQDKFVQILTDAQVEPVAQPTLSVNKISEDELEVVINVPVKPEVELGEYKGLEVKKGRVAVTKKEIEEQLSNYQSQFAELSVKEDGKVAKGDTAVIDYEGFIDGEAFDGGKGENYPLEIGSGSFIPGFEDQLIGMTTDNEQEIKVTFPEDYGAPNLAGKEATFKVTVHEIKEKHLPEIDDELAKDVNIDGVETLEQLKAHIKSQIKARKENESENKFMDDIYKALIASSKVEDSDALLKQEQDMMLQEIEQNLQRQGLNFEVYEQFTGKSKEDVLEDIKPQAEERVKLNLILEAIIKEEELAVTDEEREAELQKIADMYQRELDDVKKIFEGNMSHVENDILTRKAIDLVKDNLKK
ncbi:MULTISPECIES: trigger factor [unclassified Thomasclavelia]|uniref:Trigger factor n=1 Tax=Candidatus Erysipelatoclostridium merdavium TaxID=2838566 RepID=A0A9D2BN31_9FIRM|nr:MULTISPECIES: trigger factor [unclassified Thomasclavelia]OUP78427.1 trigger factor [Erysipelatoclostridium sp. An173]OUQ07385.1 trigger factor [Erysipelatoclostridium sp. An15]HIX82151.1 trigger factor [Candidatus Erysipelatoclostridium merdavium]